MRLLDRLGFVGLAGRLAVAAVRHPPDPATLRAAVWALGALRRVRRDLRRQGLGGARVPPPPHLPATAGRGALEIARRWPATCLQRALVVQCWQAAQGRPEDVVIGVTGTSGGFRAHAWLETETPPDAFRELLRLPAPLPPTLDGDEPCPSHG